MSQPERTPDAAPTIARADAPARSSGATKVAWQPGLFGVAAPRVVTQTRARRIELDARSWVEGLDGWLEGADVLFAHLLDSAHWEQRERRIFEEMRIEPRLTAEIGDLREAPHPALREAAAALSARYGVHYDHLWLNLYRDGRDSTAWHGDRISCRRRDCIVPVLSLGATRRFLLKSRAGGSSVVLRPASGDVVVMGGRCQRDWVHSVPKGADVAGARISINFQSREQATSATSCGDLRFKLREHAASAASPGSEAPLGFAQRGEGRDPLV